MSRWWYTLLAALTTALTCQSMVSLADSPIDPIYLYATQTGRPTLDQGEGGGNPFASALVELLDRQTLAFDAFLTDLVELTQRKSRGFQRPDVSTRVEVEDWQVLPKPDVERRVALVLVFSDYSASGSAKSLPGAKHDMQRVAKALERAGFEVQTILDPGRTKVDIALADFANRSATADVAVVYTTGHGVEIERVIYLLPGDYPVRQESDALQERALRLTTLGSALRARRVNLLFYGGCRNNPFRMP